MSRTLRLLLAVVLLATLSTSTMGVADVAAAAPVSSCSSSTGILVVVDFRHFGGSLSRGCAVSPSTGYDAMHAAGYTTTGTVHDGDGFVCRINGYPTPKQDPCYNTPPASAYWSYWHADPGQNRWSYSTQGAQSYHPKTGSIDAWVFGSTNVSGTSGGPGFTPAEARGQNSGGRGGASSPTHRVTSGARSAHAPRSNSAVHGRSHPNGAGHPSARSAAVTPSHGQGTPTGAGTSTASQGTRTTGASAAPSGAGLPASTSGGSLTPSFADASAVGKSSSTSSGSPLPVILGVALVLLLGVGGGWTVVRRRRADAAEH